MKTLVLGIGNTLLSDEGVGIHVLQALAAESPLPDDVELLDGGTLSFTLAGPIEEADALIVVDAANIKVVLHPLNGAVSGESADVELPVASQLMGQALGGFPVYELLNARNMAADGNLLAVMGPGGLGSNP